MQTENKHAKRYVSIIIKDIQQEIKEERTLEHGNERISRIYEFEDGAVVKYEWRSPDSRNSASNDDFNHRFTLESAPKSNPHKLIPGVISTIDHPVSGR